jgi:hypothetical protein
LDGDRVASLLVGMAADGVVDFRDAAPLDRRWNLRLKWLTEAYATRKRADVAVARHMRYTGALGTDDSKLFDKAWKLSGTTLDELDALLRPWIERGARDQLGDSADQALALFKELIGDMDDPAFVAEQHAIAARMLKNAGLA